MTETTPESVETHIEQTTVEPAESVDGGTPAPEYGDQAVTETVIDQTVEGTDG